MDAAPDPDGRAPGLFSPLAEPVPVALVRFQVLAPHLRGQSTLKAAAEEAGVPGRARD